MKKLLSIIVVLVAIVSANAQYDSDYNNSRDYYNDDFDWRWDVRVRITEGINNGQITRWEANRLYKRLERIEEKEYAYAADGTYEPWEQDDVWNDVQWLHAQVGLELRDNDRVYYGYTRPGVVFYGYPTWWYRGGYSFNRFDRLGYGSIRYGYNPRYYAPQHRNNNAYANRYPYRERNNTYRGTRPGNERYTNRSPRTAGRSGNYSNSRSFERNSGATRNYDRGSNNDNARRSSSIDNGSRSTPNRSESRSSSEYSRPAAPQRAEAAPSRSYSGRTESMSPLRGSSTQRSTPSRSYERSSSSSRGNSGSVGRSSSSRTTERTKLPESSRSSSRGSGRQQ